MTRPRSLRSAAAALRGVLAPATVGPGLVAASPGAQGLALAAALALAVPPVPALAQAPVLVPKVRNASSTPAPPFLAVPPDARTQRFTMPVGKSIIVDLPEDAAEVFVGRPEVANAVVRSARRLYVMALTKGPTTIFALDKGGRQLATLEINVIGRDIGELSGILKTVMPDNDIRVQAVDDTIILTGTVASAVDAQRAYDIASAFTGYTAVGAGGGASSSGGGSSVSFSSTPIVVSGSIINSLVIRGQDQVTLKVQVVEVQRTVLKQLGISLTGGSVNTGGFSGSASSFGLPSANNSYNVGSSAYSNGLNAALSWVGQKNALNSTIQALERTGVAHVLAEPNVTAVSGESARFTAGGTLPLATSSSIDPTTKVCTTTYTQTPYGVTLNFTPTVLSEGRISLHIETQVAEPDPSYASASGCANTVGFRNRTNVTTVELPSGGSIVTAGLIQQASQQAISGTPGLMNLPILGALFRSRDYQRQESELMIIVTPYLAKTLRPDQVSKPDDGFTDPSDPQSWLLGRMNRIYSTAGNPELARGYRGRVGFIND
ncbi:type II and III secretion system protein family protein [Lichenibacterium ramalinae]|uniref:Type II and III secretion system protein family protein n=1 Tax=Lichenibacterium ramalinae TaxID=2316527 RepID=A0A4Q2RHD8_9HYPH|nr:type II and III secretion system protein family protein [Lichenibacterium ramalinae]RYB07665.1 type II and III secretion system protein family protein [Lichenibacterium ramalinae]